MYVNFTYKKIIEWNGEEWMMLQMRKECQNIDIESPRVRLLENK